MSQENLQAAWLQAMRLFCLDVMRNHHPSLEIQAPTARHTIARSTAPGEAPIEEKPKGAQHFAVNQWGFLFADGSFVDGVSRLWGFGVIIRVYPALPAGLWCDAPLALALTITKSSILTIAVVWLACFQHHRLTNNHQKTFAHITINPIHSRLFNY